jgi:hypothetical protein
LLKDDCKTKLGGKTYVRIRQQVKIINAKINEGQGAHPGNDCGESYMGSLRKVGKLPDGIGGNEIFWESENHKKEDLRDFIELLTKKDDKYHSFDVYLDRNELSKLKDTTDPKYEFVRNCKETGGLVPVVEGPATPTFPPQVISVLLPTDPRLVYLVFNLTDPYYNDFKNEYAPWYIRIEEKDKPAAAKKIGSLKVTISGQTKDYDVFYHAAIIYLTDLADSKSYLYNPSWEEPPFSQPRNPTLQLTALKFITTSEWTWATPECKPALYLYPKEKTSLSVKLNPSGKLTYTNPVYGDGWNSVTAYPDGKLFYEGRTYPYLYYEAEIEKIRTPKEGWVVRREELGRFFDKILPSLGLNRTETYEFKAYWIPVLGKAPYYFVGLIPQEEIERIEPISFSQKPDTFIRVRLFFEPLQARVPVPEPEIAPIPPRQGFTAVDWGGILKSGTCEDGQLLNQKVR